MRLKTLACLLMMMSGVAAADPAQLSISAPGLVVLAADKKPVLAGPAIIQFWASWCVSCRKNMESTVETLTRSDGGQRVRFFTVSLDESPDVAKKYLERSGSHAAELISATMVDTRQELATKWKIGAVPTVLFIDAGGKIVRRIAGHATPEDVIRFAPNFQAMK